jgi:flagellar basal-body rod modification protein FlgD
MTQIPQTTSDYNSFLKLMTAQMKNQDPLAPLDATQFVTQLAQFSQVEQSVQMNSKLDNLSKSLSSLSAQTAVSMIGRQVEAEGSGLVLSGGSASFAVTIDKEPAEAIYIIRDSEGSIVRRAPLAYSGEHQRITWDGKSDNGVTMPDGAYTAEVYAADAEGNLIDTHTYVTHGIKEVIHKDGGTRLLLDNGSEVDLTADMRIS